MCARAVSGRAAEPNIVHYDVSIVSAAIKGFKVKAAFPFRPRHFFADPAPSGAAAAALDWTPIFSGSHAEVQDTIVQAYAEYIALGLHNRVVDFSEDDAILAAIDSRACVESQ
jgi:hypothetical protein